LASLGVKREDFTATETERTFLSIYLAFLKSKLILSLIHLFSHLFAYSLLVQCSSLAGGIIDCTPRSECAIQAETQSLAFPWGWGELGTNRMRPGSLQEPSGKRVLLSARLVRM
jgi:hypothetical protein